MNKENNYSKEQREILKVKSNTIDNYVQIYGKPEIIKMDIEGAEINAIKGGSNLFRQKEAPIIMIEIHSILIKEFGGTSEQIIKTLKSFGYTMWECQGGNNDLNYNYIFSKSELVSDFLVKV